MTISIPANTLEKFTTFGDLLRFLRRRMGITQTELAIEVSYSHTQISRLEQNLRLPDIPTIEARFVTALGLEDEPKAVARLLDLAANVRREDAPALGLCPYKGLNYFDESDADLFVGREVLTAKLVERVLSLSRLPHETRFIAVVGASGSGKSSLVRAGLAYALRWHKASTDWHIHVLTPTAHPFESLAATLAPEINSVSAIATLMDDLARDPRSLQIFAKRKLGLENNIRLLLVIDQFEELFALCRSEGERASFIENLLTASSEPEGRVIIVITLRADFYAHCANNVHLREALAKNQEYIGAMNDDEIRRAIEEPAGRGRWEFEPGLVDLLLYEVGHEPGALPLLSHALFETWQRRRGRVMTLGGYASSGGVRGAIAETAEAVFIDQFTNEQRSIARKIFLRLTELGDETSITDTRRRASFNELILKQEEATSTHTVLKALADARLIITSEDSVEVAHEALIREWPTLRSWLEENREGLRLHHKLTEAALEWNAMNRSPDTLCRGARLAQEREWAAIHGDEMNALEHEFMSASIEASEREVAERESQRQREIDAAQKLAEIQSRAAKQLARRAHYLTGAFILALVMAFSALFFGVRARQSAVEAQTARRIAISRELAAASLSNLDVDPERSILLALQALDTTYTKQAEEALHQSLDASRLLFSLSGHSTPVSSLAYNPDGSRLATVGDDSVIIYDTQTAESTQTLEFGDQQFALSADALAFNPSGERLALMTTSVDNQNFNLWIWELSSGDLVSQYSLPVILDKWCDVALSPDWEIAAVGCGEGMVELWDLASAQMLAALSGHPGYPSVDFSPDGSLLSTTSISGEIDVWEIPATLAAGEGVLRKSVKIQTSQDLILNTFYPASDLLVGGFSNGSVEIWSLANPEQPLVSLSGHKNVVLWVNFNPDGSLLATASLDGTAKVWEVSSGRELFTLAGHQAHVSAVLFNPDGSSLATGSADGTARIWNAQPLRGGELFAVGTGLSPTALELSPDRRWLGVGDLYGPASILNVQTGSLRFSLPGEPGTAVYGVSFSPDGSRIATVGQDNTVRVWDANHGVVLLAFTGHGGGDTGGLFFNIIDVAFSPDGERLATAGTDGTVKVWDSATGSLLLTLTGYPGGLASVRYSPDGRFIAAGSDDGDSTARVWDAHTGNLVYTLTGHELWVFGLAFSPDSSLLATSSGGGIVKIWDLASGTEVRTLPNQVDVVVDIVFSSDGRQLIVGGEATRVYDVKTGQEILTLSMTGGELAVSRDNNRLYIGSWGQGIRGVVLPLEETIELARARLTRWLTPDECRQYLYTERCPPEVSIGLR